MNKSQRKELLTFLNTLDENATIHDMSHRFLCFEYNSDRKRKDWIGTTQPMDSAPFEANVIFPNTNGLTIPFLSTIKEVKTIIEKMQWSFGVPRGYTDIQVEMICDDGFVNIIDIYYTNFHSLFGTENYN